MDLRGGVKRVFEIQTPLGGGGGGGMRTTGEENPPTAPRTAVPLAIWTLACLIKVGSTLTCEKLMMAVLPRLNVRRYSRLMYLI